QADVARLGQAVGATAVGDGQAHRVAARRGVGVDRVLGGRACAVAEVPRPGGRGTGGLIGEGHRQGGRARGRRAAEGGHRRWWRGGTGGARRRQGGGAAGAGVDGRLGDGAGRVVGGDGARP